MKSSLDLGRIAGIKVKVHWTFLLIIAWIVFLEWSRGGNLTSTLWSILFILALFVCVVFHELGHALTARKFKIGTRQITLLPIGGVASLEGMPEDPKEELLVAIAGPAVNIVIAIGLYLFVPLESFLTQDPEMLEQSMSSVNAQNFLFYLFSANIMLAVFNMIPAFPMDGGRVLRAVLSMRWNRVRATQMAATLGQGVAFFFFLIGLLYNPILILIAIFIYFGAQGENVMVQQLGMLKDHKVQHAMMTDITPLHPDDDLEEVVDIILTGTERDFVVVENGEVCGVLYQSDLMNSFQKRDKEVKVRDIMDTNFLTVQKDDQLTDIYGKIRSKNKIFFPVLDGRELAGAIDMNNINEFMVFRASHDY